MSVTTSERHIPREVSDDEDAFITAMAASDPDNPPLTEEELAQFTPAILDSDDMARVQAAREAFLASGAAAEMSRLSEKAFQDGVAEWRAVREAAKIVRKIG
jgi:hypothetical protein